MGTGYTRQDNANNIANGNIINADDLDAEFDQIALAFGTSGHSHDGTAEEGGRINTLGPSGEFIASSTTVTPNSNNTVDIGTSSLQFKDLYIDGMAYIDGLNQDVLVDTNKKVQFRDNAIHIQSSVDGQLDIVADAEVQIDATKVDINANLEVSGSLTVGTTSFSEATLSVLNGASVTTDELNYNDTGAAVGTVVANKTVTADANKDVASFRNLTLTGNLNAANATLSSTLNAATLDISGDVDIDGTLETDTLSINSTVVTSTAAELNILDGVTSSTAELNYNNTGASVGTVVANKTVTVDSNKDVSSFRNITSSGVATSGSIVIDDAGTIGSASDTDAIAIASNGDISISQDLTVSGNLTISGVTTTVNSSEINLADNLVLINSSFTGASPPTNQSYGIEIERGNAANVSFVWDELNDKWSLGSETLVANTFEGASLDISGNIDVDGTTNLDAVDIDGAVQLDNTFTVGVDDTGYDVKFFGDTASAYVQWDASEDDLILGGTAGLIVPDGKLTLNSTAVTSTAAELNILDGNTSATSTTIEDADRVVINDNGSMVQVAVTDLAAYFDDEITAMPNLVTTAATTVGVLNSGQIGSGFGSINTGSSEIRTTGSGLFGAVGVTGDLDISGNLKLSSTAVTSTAAELNIMDGDTSASTVTIADSDQMVLNDGGIMKQIAASTLKSYTQGLTFASVQTHNNGVTNSTFTTFTLATLSSGQGALILPFVNESRMDSNPYQSATYTGGTNGGGFQLHSASATISIQARNDGSGVDGSFSGVIIIFNGAE